MESSEPVSLDILNIDAASSPHNDVISPSENVENTEHVVESIENVEQVVEQVVESIENAEHVVEQVVEQVAENVEQVIEIIETVEQVVEQVIETVEQAVEHVNENVEQAVEQVVESIETVEQAVEQVAENVEQVVEQVIESIETVEQAVEQVAESIETVEQAVEQVAESIETVEQAVEHAVESSVEKIELETSKGPSEKYVVHYLQNSHAKEIVEQIKQTIENQKHKADDAFNSISKKVFDKLLSKHDSLRVANAYDIIIMIMEIIEEIYLLDEHDVDKKVILIEVLERISKGVDGIAGTDDDLINKNTVDTIRKILENRLVEGIVNTIVRASKGLININKKKCKSWFCCFK